MYNCQITFFIFTKNNKLNKTKNNIYVLILDYYLSKILHVQIICTSSKSECFNVL